MHTALSVHDIGGILGYQLHPSPRLARSHKGRHIPEMAAMSGIICFGMSYVPDVLAGPSVKCAVSLICPVRPAVPSLILIQIIDLKTLTDEVRNKYRALRGPFRIKVGHLVLVLVLIGGSTVQDLQQVVPPDSTVQDL
jgi:hypothetical protein